LDGAWNIGEDRARLNRNLYWNVGQQPISFAGKSLEQWRALGHDKDSLVADPLFVNWKADNFALQANSPARKLGFVPFDISKAGRLSREGRALKYLGTAPRAFPAPPAMLPMLPLAEDFEDGRVGEKWQFTTNEDAKVPAATARISDEAASPFEPKGKQSLRISDAPGQDASFNPHIFADPKYLSGTIRGRFDLKRGANSVLYHEWRDAAQPYHVGPTLYIEANGDMNSAGQKLINLPADKWARLEITCALGSGAWNLSVTDESGQKRDFALKCSPDMKALRWWGFVANGSEDAVAFIDNAQVAPMK
jgi:hypothetical protein